MYVVVWNGDGISTSEPRLFRVDGLRAPELVRVVEYEAALTERSFLRFVIRSHTAPDQHELYEVAVSADGATATPVQGQAPNPS